MLFVFFQLVFIICRRWRDLNAQWCLFFKENRLLKSLNSFLPGLIIYFGYGVRNSVQKQRLRDARVQLRAAVNPDVAA